MQCRAAARLDALQPCAITCREHDAAAFLRAGAQNDAVEALELLAAATEHEMRQVPQGPPGDPAKQNDGPAHGLAFAARLGQEDGGGMHAILGGIVVPVCAADGRTGDPSEGGHNGSPSSSASTAVLSDTQECGTAGVDGTTAAAHAEGSGTAALEAQGEHSLRRGILRDCLQPSAGSNKAALEPDCADGVGSKPPPASVAPPEAPRNGPARLPMQGLQAHELVCSRCGTPHETQLTPFFVVPLGARTPTV